MNTSLRTSALVAGTSLALMALIAPLGLLIALPAGMTGIAALSVLVIAALDVVAAVALYPVLRPGGELLAQIASATRVAYVDVDVHHGDGVQAMFWDDPRVLTLSMHESGRMLFPGTGDPADIGVGDGLGCAVNVALPPGTSDAGWLRAFHSVAPAVVRAFAPDVLVTQHGCDSHFLDPLAHLEVSVDAQRTVQQSLHDLAHEVCDGRWLATGGGGYEVVDVVPRSWAHLVAIAAHRPVPTSAPVPQAWLDHVKGALGRTGPASMGDGRETWWRSWEVGYDPEDPVDRAVMATRKAIFPLHGLDPWFD